jgi:hypothetical protein
LPSTEAFFPNPPDVISFRDGRVLGTVTPPDPEFGHPVYAQDEINSWSTSSPEYTRLANRTHYGNVNALPSNALGYSTTMTNQQLEYLSTGPNGGKADAIYMKCQAVLWAADGNELRRTKVHQMLFGLSPVTSIAELAGSANQADLAASWAFPNIVQAAAITGYPKETMDPLFRYVFGWMSILAQPNQHASVADAKLCIAAYLEDQNLWDDAVAYFETKIRQSIWHSDINDGFRVDPILDSSGLPHNITEQQWGYGIGGTPSDFVNPMTPLNSGYAWCMTERFGTGSAKHFDLCAPFRIDGMNGECRRDLDHVSMSYAGWSNCIRTIRAQGFEPSADAMTLYAAGVQFHYNRVLDNIVTLTAPSGPQCQAPPVNPLSTTDKGGRFLGAHSARVVLGDDTPQEVIDFLETSTMAAFHPEGDLAWVAHAFTDEYP